MSATAKSCGCVEDYDPEHDAWFVVAQCAEHSAASASADVHLRKLLDYEMDALVQEAAGGKRVNRIWPADHTK